MYGIDLGEVYDVSANDVNELLPSLRNVPPLCLRVVLESCCNTSKCDEFELLDEGTICTIKICKFFCLTSFRKFHSISNAVFQSIRLLLLIIFGQVNRYFSGFSKF